MALKLWTVLPKDDVDNGLSVIEKIMNDDPDKQHVIIARIDRKRATIEDDDHSFKQTVRMLQVEVITDEDAIERAQAMLDARRQARTGERVLFDRSGAPSDDDADGGSGVSPAFLAGVPDSPGDDD